MSTSMQLQSAPRVKSGKAEMRRMRRLENLVPGIVYGAKSEPVQVELSHKDLYRAAQRESFFSQVFTLVIGDKKEDVVVKAIQRHPYKQLIQHIDFQRISKTTKLSIHVPLHYLNEDVCVGVKQQGGTIFHDMTDIEITCLPKDLPEFIEVDTIELESGNTIHLSELKLPKGVQITALLQSAEHDATVVRVVKVVESDEPEDDIPAAEQPEEESDS